MLRDDLSNKLIHMVRGETVEIAFKKFESILLESKLRGGTGYIKGGYRCVCFTETPISKLGYVLASPDVQKMRYRPLGIMVDKKWVFRKGGRPAIYQPNEDFEKLSKDIRYRHVCLELDRPGTPVDLTWEREWRLHADELVLPPEATTVIVPRRYWRDVLIDTMKPFPWHVIVLEDLGVPIPDGLE